MVVVTYRTAASELKKKVKSRMRFILSVLFLDTNRALSRGYNEGARKIPR